MSQYQENIHIAILGPVSAGKSTLLNGLFATTYSQMKKKRTTMMPNIYQIYP
jgi:GTPase Era involved in 16S rRNA processing